MAQKDGCYPRVNGTMLQSLQFDGMIVNPFELNNKELDIQVRSGVLLEALGPEIWVYPGKYRPFLIRYTL